MTEDEFLAQYNIHDYNVPLCTVDIAIFSLIDNQVHILAVQRDEHPCKAQWALPGGFIHLNEDSSTEAAAHRTLQQKTGMNSAYLEQVTTVSSPNRDPRGWSLTVLYFALVDIQQVVLDDTENKASWMPLSELTHTKLAFDHNDLIHIAMARLRAKATYTALPIELMPKEFTLTELQSVFELILGRELQAKAFRSRVLSANMVEETGKSKISGKRPAKLFQSTGINRELYFNRPLSNV
ncbi:MAG: NUDIX hydrolase [Marinomonas sp.]